MKLVVIDSKTFDTLDKKLITPYVEEMIKMQNEYYKKTGFLKPWVGYFVISDNTIIGACGFKGKPVENKVEIAYHTFPEFEGKGFATQMIVELIKIAKNSDPNILVSARTLTEENASTNILKKNNFTLYGVVIDPDDGAVWEWHLK